MKTLLTIIACSPLFLGLAYADSLNPDIWEWQLLEVQHGHTYQGSVDAENTGYVTVQTEIDKSATGTVTFLSTVSDDPFCSEQYVLSWNILNFSEVIDVVDTVDIQIDASASGNGPASGGQCAGSYDTLNSAGGNLGVARPMFLPPEKWDGALYTDGTVSPTFVHGFSEPHSATGTISFPYIYQPEENYPDYAAFRISAAIANDNAGTVEYMVVYIYERVKKSSPVRVANFDGPQKVTILGKDVEKTYKVTLKNDGPETETGTIIIYIKIGDSINTIEHERITYQLIPGEEREYETKVVFRKELNTPEDFFITAGIEPDDGKEGDFKTIKVTLMKPSSLMGFLKILLL